MKKDSTIAIVKFLELKEIYKDTLIIVEGKKDKEALKLLGFNKIAMLDKPLYKVIEGINEKKVIILTDLDKEGKKLYYLLRSSLLQRGVFIDNKLRDLLFKTDLKQIEGLTRYLQTLDEKINSPRTFSQ